MLKKKYAAQRKKSVARPKRLQKPLAVQPNLPPSRNPNPLFPRRLLSLPAHRNALVTAHRPVARRTVVRSRRVPALTPLQRSLAHHTEIVAALRAGDPEWARAVMTAHIHNARAVMVRAAARPR